MTAFDFFFQKLWWGHLKDFSIVDLVWFATVSLTAKTLKRVDLGKIIFLSDYFIIFPKRFFFIFEKYFYLNFVAILYRWQLFDEFVINVTSVFYISKKDISGIC